MVGCLVSYVEISIVRSRAIGRERTSINVLLPANPTYLLYRVDLTMWCAGGAYRVLQLVHRQANGTLFPYR